MLHPSEFAGDFTDGIRGNLSPDRADGRQIVLHIVQARNAYLRLVHHKGTSLPAADIDIPLLIGIGPKGGLLLPGEAPEISADTGRKGEGGFVVQVEDCPGKGVLMEEDILLGVDVLLHGPVDVQMVGGDVGHNRHLGRKAHG